MNVSRFGDFYKFHLGRQVGENLKQSLKMNEPPTSKPSVRLKPPGSQGLGWSLGGDPLAKAREPIFQRMFQVFTSCWEPREGIRTPFSINVSRFSDFHEFSIIRQVGEDLKQSLKMN